MPKRIALILAGLVAVATIVGCQAIDDDPVVKGHKEIVENVGDWGSKFADGLDGEISPEPTEQVCSWGDCDTPPDLEDFGIIDDNQNGINDADE